MTKEQLRVAREYAIKVHKETNHRYGEFPYSFHLKQVVREAKKIIPKDYLDRNDILAACWLHDTIEDCRKTYFNILKVTNPMVAEIVYAVSNEKGRSRADRANARNTLFS